MCEAQFTGAEVVSMLAGRYLGQHPITWYAPEYIGWQHDLVREAIEIPEDSFRSDGHPNARRAVDERAAELRRANPGCRVDPHYDDAWNGHRRLDGPGRRYTVAFSILRPPADAAPPADLMERLRQALNRYDAYDGNGAEAGRLLADDLRDIANRL